MDKYMENRAAVAGFKVTQTGEDKYTVTDKDGQEILCDASYGFTLGFFCGHMWHESDMRIKASRKEHAEWCASFYSVKR
jgi:hypothetical protein